MSTLKEKLAMATAENFGKEVPCFQEVVEFGEALSSMLEEVGLGKMETIKLKEIDVLQINFSSKDSRTEWFVIAISPRNISFSHKGSKNHFEWEERNSKLLQQIGNWIANNDRPDVVKNLLPDRQPMTVPALVFAAN